MSKEPSMNKTTTSTASIYFYFVSWRQTSATAITARHSSEEMACAVAMVTLQGVCRIEGVIHQWHISIGGKHRYPKLIPVQAPDTARPERVAYQLPNQTLSAGDPSVNKQETQAHVDERLFYSLTGLTLIH